MATQAHPYYSNGALYSGAKSPTAQRRNIAMLLLGGIALLLTSAPMVPKISPSSTASPSPAA